MDRNSGACAGVFFVLAVQILGGVRLFRNPPGLKSTGQEEWPSCPVFSVANQPLHDLRHKAAHSFRRLILHLPGGVGVGVQGVAPF